MKGSTALIIGGTSDIGLAIARSFAQNGFSIQLAARKTEELPAIENDFRIRYNVSCTSHYFDASQTETHAAFWTGLPTVPDVVIYVIGYMTDNERALVDWKETEATITTNYTGAVSILNLVAQSMKEKRSGTIIGVSSVAGNRGRQSNFIYGSAKAAFTAYLSGLRNYMFHYGVHVMTVLPGFVDTEMTSHLSLPPLLTASPEEVGEAVYKASRHKTDVLYVKWFWRYIMLVITSLPEFIFKKKKL